MPCEVFGIDRADLADPWYEFRLCTTERGPTAVAARLCVESPYRLDVLADADTVIVPACADRQAEPPAALLDAL